MEKRVRSIGKRFRVTQGPGERSLGFGKDQVPLFDPFLLFEEIRSEHPQEDGASFPWHPHQGINTFTHLYEGELHYKDREGDREVLSAGEALCIEAGRGIIHQELPCPSIPCWLIHVWVNMPKAEKHHPPRVRRIPESEIPVYRGSDGLIVKVLSGDFRGHENPVMGKRPILLLDLHIPPLLSFSHSIPQPFMVFAYLLEGKGVFSYNNASLYSGGDVLLFDEGETVSIRAEDEELRVLLGAGLPLGEPIYWSGSIVVSSNEELEKALRDYDEGSFLP